VVYVVERLFKVYEDGADRIPSSRYDLHVVGQHGVMCEVGNR